VSQTVNIRYLSPLCIPVDTEGHLKSSTEYRVWKYKSKSTHAIYHRIAEDIRFAVGFAVSQYGKSLNMRSSSLKFHDCVCVCVCVDACDGLAK